MDANVFFDALIDRHKAALELLDVKGHDLLTNEYALKEFRRVCATKSYSLELVNSQIDLLRQRCTILPTPSKEEFSRYRLTDKSDRPHVASAAKARCPLVTHDRKLAQEAAAYLEVLTAEQALERLRQSPSASGKFSPD